MPSGTIVSNLLIKPSSTQSIVGNTIFTNVQWGEQIAYYWCAGLTTWYRNT
jgi:hypothetical protein